MLPMYLRIILRNYKMSQIAIVNQSTLVSDDDGISMAQAMNLYLPRFCKDWKLPLFTAVYIGKKQPTNILWKVYLRDTADHEGTLGYHEQVNNISVGYVFVNTIFSYGGVMLYSPKPGTFTVSQTLCHEIFELLSDSNANLWADNWAAGALYAYESVDPVQSNIIKVTVSKKIVVPAKPLKLINGKFQSTKSYTQTINTIVGLSDWVLPSWFDPQEKNGPFNHLKTLKKPFQVDDGGYAIKLVDGNIDYEFSSTLTETRKSLAFRHNRAGIRIKKKI
jgi:hypothetical protein